MERVNRADLDPGDTVHFPGRRRVRRRHALPGGIGSQGAPIRFTPYGTGRARLPEGVYLDSVAFIELDRLSITGPSQGIASGSTGDGARNITISRSTISDVAIGINAANRDDRSWRIAGNVITGTGDSGIIDEGGGFEIIDNTVTDTGRDDSISYSKHGLYAKGPDTRVIGNRFVTFETEGVSTRYRNAVIADNTMRGGETGVGYYREDPRSGTTVICGNRMELVRWGSTSTPRTSAGTTRSTSTSSTTGSAPPAARRSTRALGPLELDEHGGACP